MLAKMGHFYMVQEDWPFDEPQNLAVISTRQVMEGEAPILFVSHDEEDEGWQFLTGGLLIEADARVVAPGGSGFSTQASASFRTYR
jgi:hypothetical protein